MPLPPTALTINGGCNCGAVRYKISIPDLDKRPLHASSTSDNPVFLPIVVTDHCNDCRRATASILPAWICSPITMVTGSLVLRSKLPPLTKPARRKDQFQEERGPWLPAVDVFNPGPASNDSFLTFYESSEGRRRSFCGRCGTNLAYTAWPMPEGWLDMLDIILGTVDRAALETSSLEPERQLWWDYGIEWVKALTDRGVAGLPKHPSYHVNEII